MRKWGVFMCSAAAGTFTSAAAARHNWGFAIVDLLLAAGFAFVAWYHLDKLKEGP